MNKKTEAAHWFYFVTLRVNIHLFLVGLYHLRRVEESRQSGVV